jgi:hypothetical protein
VSGLIEEVEVAQTLALTSLKICISALLGSLIVLFEEEIVVLLAHPTFLILMACHKASNLANGQQLKVLLLQFRWLASHGATAFLLFLRVDFLAQFGQHLGFAGLFVAQGHDLRLEGVVLVHERLDVGVLVLHLRDRQLELLLASFVR